MAIDNDQVAKFQELYKNRFGKDISREDALEQGIKLIRLIEITYKPMKKFEYQQIQKLREENNNN